MDGKTRFLDTLRGREVDRPPVWLYRQAGRWLPEYRAVRERYPLEAMLQRADVAAELTLQPVRRFDLDVALVFSDLLVPLAGMGRPVRFADAGPVVSPPVRSPADVDGLTLPAAGEGGVALAETIRRVREDAPDKAVLGFSAGPWTLAAWLIEGRAVVDHSETKAFARRHPEAFDRLLDLCSRALASHLALQAHAGADALQVFDTGAEVLAPTEFAASALPAARDLVRRARANGVPVLYYARGPHLVAKMRDVAADAIGVDWRVDLREARQVAGPAVALQGNLDPAVLTSPLKVVEQETRSVLEAGEAAGRHVFNLGSGLLPGTPVESVEAVVGAVKGWAR